MSHANTGHSKEMVQNEFCGNILAYTYPNLKLRPILEVLGQIIDFTTFSNHFKPPKGLKIRKYQKNKHVTKNTKVDFFPIFSPNWGDLVTNLTEMMKNRCPTVNSGSLKPFLRLCMLQWPSVQIWGESPGVGSNSLTRWSKLSNKVVLRGMLGPIF